MTFNTTSEFYFKDITNEVLNLVINGWPSILGVGEVIDFAIEF